jgi:hypothetical protein
MRALFTPSVLVCAWLLALGAGCASEALDSAEPADGAETDGRVVRVVEDQAATPDVVVVEQPLYPAGPYGTAVGATIANLSFVGWRDPVAAKYDRKNFETLRLSDFYNPNGEDGAPRVLVLNASAVWCSVCQSEYNHLSRDQIYANYRPLGIEILGVLFEDVDGLPARPQDLELWGGADGFDVTFPLVLDPGFKSGIYFDSDATPLNMIIDTQTMKILDVMMGFDARTPQAYWADIAKWLSK